MNKIKMKRNIKLLFCFCIFELFTTVASSVFQKNLNVQRNFQPSGCWPLGVELSKNIQSATCKPRETMVDLVSDFANIMIFPNKIPVKRCNGGTCIGHASCLPVDKRIRKYAVRKHDFSTNKEFCGIVHVEEHLLCKCGCSIMDHHCNSKQIYKPKECTCECIDNDEMDECTQMGRIWDHKTCNCECNEKHSECSTGTEWVPSKCQCMKTFANLEYDNREDQISEQNDEI